MAEHINQHNLELLFLSPDSVSAEEKRKVETHIESCSLCHEHWQKLSSFYETIDRTLDSPPTQRDIEFAESSFAKRRALPERGLELSRQGLRETLETYAEVIQPYRRSAMQRFVQWVRFNPVKFASATALAIASLAMLTMTVRITRDMNPTFADVENGILSVYNKEGKTIWTKAAFGIPDWKYPFPFQRPTEEFSVRLVGLEDIDGNGRNVVLVTGDHGGGTFAKDTLYCFESDGTIRWRVYAGDPILFGDKNWATQSRWGILDYFTLKETKDSKPRLFVVSNAIQFFPNRLFEVDPSDGREVASYLHAGPITCANVADINGDGRSEILLGGMSRPYLQAMLVVLDPSNINGYSVCTPDFVVVNTAKANEMYYILFPKTDVFKAGNPDPFNMTNRILPGVKGFLQVFVDELPIGAKTRARLVYSVGPNMKVDGAVGNSFDTAHERLKKEGKITSTLDEAYRQNLLSSIQYWDGEKFVHTPTMNKRYKGILHSLP